MTLLLPTRQARRAIDRHMAAAAARVRAAAELGTWDGRRNPVADPYFRRCVRDDGPTGTRLIFTRDIGHHSSGWFKNPDYERCYHLSISTWDAPTGQPVNHLDGGMAMRWVEAIYGDNVRLAWREPAASAAGRERDVVHWRLFCDPHWQPIKPRGEVYSLDFTELGWKTYSQVRAETGLVVTSPLNPHAE